VVWWWGRSSRKISPKAPAAPTAPTTIDWRSPVAPVAPAMNVMASALPSVALVRCAMKLMELPIEC
jgi:hypothetical protein